MVELNLLLSLKENTKDTHIALKKHQPKAETILNIFAISILGEINIIAYPIAQMLIIIHKAKNVALIFDFLFF